MTDIDSYYNCTGDPNPEVKQRWYPLGISLNYVDVIEPSHQFVGSMGRLKYLTPIYQALQDYGHHDLGVQWYNEFKDFYHPIAAASVAKTLGITEVHNKKTTYELIKLEKKKAGKLSTIGARLMRDWAILHLFITSP